jgi:hypothetical protein
MVVLRGALVMVMLIHVAGIMVMLIISVGVDVIMTMLMMIVNVIPVFLLCAVEPKLGRCISNDTSQSANTGQDISEIILNIRIY